MDHQRLAAVEVGQDVFRSPPQADDFAALEPGGEVAREGATQVAPPRLGMGDGAAFQRGGDPPLHSLDFGQFGHT